MKTFSICILLLTFLGCSSMGEKKIADPSLISQVRPGVTTKDEVRAIFGDPYNVSFNDKGDETWLYMYTRSTVRPTSFIPVVGIIAGGADMNMHNLTVVIDNKGIVSKIAPGKMTGGAGSIFD